MSSCTLLCPLMTCCRDLFIFMITFLCDKIVTNSVGWFGLFMSVILVGVVFVFIHDIGW